jgi:O-antigen ligase
MKSGVSIQGLERITQIAVISGLVISATLIIRDTNESVHFRAMYIYSIAFTLVNTVYLIFLGLPRDFSGVFVNPNVMAMYTLVVFSLLLIVYNYDINDFVSDKLILICSILLYLIILLTGSRSAFLSVNILLAIYIVYPYIQGRSFLYNTLFIISLLGPITLALVLLNSKSLGYYEYIQSVSTELFGKQTILYERGIIWSKMINIILDNPIIGVGSGYTPSDFMNTGLSGHNLYLQIAMQSGILGLLSVFYLLWYLWDVLCRYGGGTPARVSASFLICVLFHQMFEVVLFQNNIPIAVGMWLVLSIGLGLCGKRRS